MAKKIGAIASLSIIGLLIIATIIMANIQINYNINCATPDKIYVNYNNGSYSLVTSETHKNKIVELINNASNESSLSALFNGNFGKTAEVKTESKAKNTPSNADFYVEFVYSTPQDLMVGDEKYQDSNGNTFTYQRLVFTVTKSEEAGIVKVYIIDNNENTKSYTRYYEVEANLSNLYNYLMENNLNN